MKKAVAIVVGILVVTVMVCGLNTSAIAKNHHGFHGGHGHHGFHGFNHGGWGWGYGGYAMAVDDCYTVRRCRIDRFGFKRCRLVEVCY
jgi:hypothetical protein